MVLGGPRPYLLPALNLNKKKNKREKIKGKMKNEK